MMDDIGKIAIFGRERKPELQKEDEQSFSAAVSEFWRRHGKSRLMAFPEIVREIRKIAQTTCGRALSPEFVTMELCEEFWWSEE